MSHFSHLHVHTQYSLLDGAASVKKLFKKAAADKMPAIAITDHGNMFGAFEFVKEAWNDTVQTGTDANGNPIKTPRVKPIVGCEFYMVKDRHQKTFTKEVKDDRYHQVLLAKNATGYQNLIKLTSLGYMEGMYSKYPRIDKELLLQHSEGLIATTCCIGAHVPQAILQLGEEAAEKEFKWWLDIFGEDYYIELQRHQMKEQELINQTLLKFSKKFNVPVIATNDSHYVDQDDYNAHDILLCINTGEKQSTPGFDDFVNDDLQLKNRRFKFPNDQFYFKTSEEMSRLFSDIPESIDNTNAIVDKVEVLNLKKDILLPAFPIPQEFVIHTDANLNQYEYLKHLTEEGAVKRYSEITPEIRERIDFELFTIRTMGFAGYFLIVSDFIRAGREMGVFVGPGRGSAAGSVVAYCIGITNIDPIKYDLLFERFLNPDRKSMPDIDTDFDDEGRQKVIDYVVDKYGKNQVAQIVTYGTMAAKSSIKDVARVIDLPLAESNLLAKLVPDKPGTELRRVLHAPLTKKEGEKSLEEKEAYQPDDIENIKKLREIYRGDDIRAKVLKEAERLEGTVRNTGIHAAGIIIAPADLTTLIPVATAKDSKLLITQIEGKVIEEAGVIKMDFLGLKTLSIIKNALELIKQNHGISIDIDTIPLDDELTYQLFQKGNAIAVFQFEAAHLAGIFRDIKPTVFEDLIALNALNRPGPMQYIPEYVKRKHGRETVSYDLPEMEEYLKETYGITIYQEQVMLLSQKIAGFSKGKADGLRKAMGKKDRKALDELKEAFMKGALEKNHPKDKLEKIWTDWESFAEYAFNKSHSTCYTFVSYQTAYLKAHYPGEFMSAVLNYAKSIENITFFMEECKRMGIKVLGPDVNESLKGFAVNKKGEIRFGLGGLKGVGDAAVDHIIEERERKGPYANIFNFIERVIKQVNKKSLESLVYSGAFDCFSDFHRAQYFTVPEGERFSGLEKMISYGQAKQQVSAGSSNTLFGELTTFQDVPLPKLSATEPWTLTELLEFEKEVTGMFMSGHPLDHFKFELTHYGINPMQEFNEFRDTVGSQGNPGKLIRVAGLVTSVQHKITRTGKNYGVVVMEDYTGKAEFTVWSEEYVRFQAYFEKGKKIVLTGNFRPRYKDATQFEWKINQVMLLESVMGQLTRSVDINLHPASVSEEVIQFVETNVKKYPGKSSIKFHIVEPAENIKITLRSFDFGFQMNDEMADYLLQQPDFGIHVAMVGQ
jgi:DNA polymerase-3 subunit alpha